MSVSVFRDQVAVSWRLPPLQPPLQKVKRFRKSQPDFKWTRIHLIISKNHIRGGFNDWLKDDSPAFTSEFNRDAWINLLKTGEIHLGGVRSNDENAIESPTSMQPFTSTYASRNHSLRNLHMIDKNYYDRTSTTRLDYQNEGLLNSNNVDLIGSDIFPTEPGTQDSDGFEFWMGSEGTVGESFKVHINISKSFITPAYVVYHAQLIFLGMFA